MNIHIDDITLNELKNELAKKTKPYSVKIYISSIRCGGPTLSLSLYEHKEGDKITVIDGVSFFIEEGLSEFEGDLEISKGLGSSYKIELVGMAPTC